MAESPPLARRLPGFDARHSTRRARRTKRLLVVVVLVAAGGAAYAVVGGGGPSRPTPPHHPPPAAATVSVVTTLASWQLGAPITREVVLPGPAGTDELTIVGGSTTGGLAASGAFALDVDTGTLTQVGDLSTTLDEAAGAVIGSRDVIFGGTPSSSFSSASATVQALPVAASDPTASTTMATAAGTLPETRAGATAVTVGTTTYLVGGENAAGADPVVLATADGTHFTAVATLPVPVVFPAVAVAGGRLYVLGGQAVTGADAGRPVATVQVVDLATHKVGRGHRLPEPLAGAAAVGVGTHLLLAGGDTDAGATSTSSTTTAAAAGTAAVSTISTVWVSDPSTGTWTTVGELPLAVSHAGLAVLGNRAWLVGGESGDTPAAGVQSIETTTAAAHGAHGGGRG
ncbi:MAG: hypothetical protein ACRDY1_07830 [Acidimicrobiales bacterium]